MSILVKTYQISLFFFFKYSKLNKEFEYDAKNDSLKAVGSGIKVHSKEFGLAYEDWPSFDYRMKNGVENWLQNLQDEMKVTV